MLRDVDQVRSLMQVGNLKVVPTDILVEELMDTLKGVLGDNLKVDILKVEPKDIPKETSHEVDRNQEGIMEVHLQMVAVKLVGTLEELLMA